jgi:hypothetical protein
VHEAYLRLVGGDPNRIWNRQAHFLAAAADLELRRRVEALLLAMTRSTERRHRIGDCMSARSGSCRPCTADPVDISAVIQFAEV